jgi:phage host-nuclease inhibitor protein Gam
MARPCKPACELGSLEECNRAMGLLLDATLEIERLVAKRDKEIAALQTKYEPALDKQRAQKAELLVSLEAYYRANIAELERGARKSYELGNGVMGRRLDPPKLALLNRAWTWVTVAAKVRAKYGLKYLRIREPELDKDLVKADLDAGELAACGLKVVQTEEFYAEPARLPEAEVAR